MDQYNGFLQKISIELGIEQGKKESVERWKTRIIYSILGRMAYASLFDGYEEPLVTMQDSEPISIVHLKRRVQKLFDAYLELYPEVSNVLNLTSQDLSDEIYEVFNKAGFVYHRPHRICASLPCYAEIGDIRFERGMPLNRLQLMSGLGIFTHVHQSPAYDRATKKPLPEMFGFTSGTLESQWNMMTSSPTWQTIMDTAGVQFLREQPPFRAGYWLNAPSRMDGGISICRTGLPGNHQYYLYQVHNKTILISPIPYQYTSDPHFGQASYAVANCCLAANGKLPAFIFHVDGPIVMLSMEYLLPPPELYFLRLYSWPAYFSGRTESFRRLINTSVFTAIRTVLEARGYLFQEVS